MKEKFITQKIKYDGLQLSSLWAFRNFDLQGDSIVSFRGPCHVELTEMVDLADVKEAAHIYSEEMLHFIVEHFDLDLEKAVTRQRLLIAIIKEQLEKVVQNVKLQRRGDDLYWGEKKLSVSIATLSPVSSLIHIGLNVISDNTPVLTVGLKELGVESIDDFAQLVTRSYVEEVESIYLARCKVRGVG